MQLTLNILELISICDGRFDLDTNAKSLSIRMIIFQYA